MWKYGHSFSIEKMEHTDLENQLIALNNYIERYNEKITIANAQQAIDEFVVQWKYLVDKVSSGDRLYGNALITYTCAIYYAGANQSNIENLSSLIYEYDTHPNTKYFFEIKEALFVNLGLCYHSIGQLYDDMAIKALKKHIYYLIARSNRTVYYPIAYKFTRISTYVYQSLVNEQLNMSPPKAFNDPFDCPIISAMDLPENKKDEISALIKKVYNECVKVTSLCSNYVLESCGCYDSIPHNRVQKTKSDKEEFLNVLMCAHYTDNHKGICIKYHFNNSIPQLFPNEHSVAYFKDVKYSDDALDAYTNKEKMNLSDVFFLKGKPWEYENELRYLYFDIENQKEYSTVDIPCSVEAIYFGLKCSDKDKETIIKIMKGKKYLLRGKQRKEVEFYQMKVDEEHFGQLKAVKIDV